MASSLRKCKEQTLTAQGPQAEAQGLGHYARGGRQRPCGQEHCARAHKAHRFALCSHQPGMQGQALSVQYCTGPTVAALRSAGQAGGSKISMDLWRHAEARYLRYCIWQRRLQRAPRPGTMPCSAGLRPRPLQLPGAGQVWRYYVRRGRPRAAQCAQQHYAESKKAGSAQPLLSLHSTCDV
jgi:hypothetical protein